MKIDAAGHFASTGMHQICADCLQLEISSDNHLQVRTHDQGFDHNSRFSPNQDLSCMQIDVADHSEATGVHGSSADHTQLELS